MKRLLLAVALGCMSLPAVAADDLLGLYREARESDPVFEQARAQRRTAEEGRPRRAPCGSRRSAAMPAPSASIRITTRMARHPPTMTTTP
ncbi:MAG: hypothetical protein U5L11_14645 [Arhodomonas sp.]|nr:hypothetical protein [Arhodomonas sp.]